MKIIILILIFLSLLVSGCGLLSSYNVRFIDQSTNTPIANVNIEVHELILCESGGDCPNIVLYSGKTNDQGIVKLPEKIIKMDVFRIQIVSGRFEGQGTRIDHKWLGSGKRDPNIVVVSGFNKEGTESIDEEYDINKDIIKIKLWHRDYWT
ncbi:hypothetical protein KY337_02475 [Candidatus Woesearchaeota archaeon]|nr:hypothetical protein [Candidatus Woesearchaeota archaeon]